MELHFFVLFCTLLSSIAAYSLFDEFNKNNSLSSITQESNCRCENGRCVKDNRGKYKCNCKRGYALQDESTCAPCDCGDKGKCMFLPLSRSPGGVFYQKKCLCDLGSAEKDGKCIDCHCGENSKCEFEDGEKICYCIEGYAEKEGVCTKCDCGTYGECTFEGGRKVCTCDDDYDEIDGYCVHKCDNFPCENGGTCDIDKNGKPFCQCTSEYVGENCKTHKCSLVTCHNGGTCGVEGGNAVCKCLQRYQGRNCEIDKCSFIECQNGGYCGIQYGKAFCKCQDEYEGKNCEIEKCSKLACQNDGKCVVRGGKAVCDCPPKYVGNNCEKARCSVNYPCQNGGYCKDGTCNCRRGTSGGFCEIIDQCPGLCPARSDINCTYDVKQERAYCDCLQDKMGYNPDTKQCKRACEEYDCKNGGKCTPNGYSKFCKCPEGTTGELCEDIPKCKTMYCGKDASCQYDTNKREAVCKCLDNNMAFDPTDKRCKKSCRQDQDCLNGGTCAKNELYSGYCRCLTGTRGDFCEEVPGCLTKRCGDNAQCVYDVGRKTAVCKCLDKNSEFDPIDSRCKKTCRSSFDCKNGGSCIEGDKLNVLSKFCRCLNGTVGDFCEKVPGCDAKDCGRDARCVFDQGKRTATCKCNNQNLAFDAISKVCKMPCTRDALCKNGGICMPRGDYSFCHCREGTSGNFCEDVEICNKLCGNRNDVLCKFDLDQKIAECICKDNKYEFDATTRSCRPCDCGGKEISCSIRDGKKVCVCPDGYATINGKCEKRWCTEKKCSNGKCEVINGEEVCRCYEGFYLDGDECRRTPCTKTPCLNGTCVVRNNGREECICPAGYSLRFNECIRGACKMTTCFGGQCKVVDGELMCVCPERYGLEGVGCFETVCKISRCFGGWCKVIKGEEVCTCHEGYVLVNDVCKKILCQKKNCFGGQCLIQNGQEVCKCPQGYSIVEDVCVRDGVVVKG